MAVSEQPDEPPPFLGAWTRVYVLVLGCLLIVIVALYAFQRFFS